MFPSISESSSHDDEKMSPLSKRYEMMEETRENPIASVFRERHYNDHLITVFCFTLSTWVERQSEERQLEKRQSWDIHEIDLRQS